MTTATPKPPKGLSPSAQKVWRVAVNEYALGRHDLELLKAACEQLTRADTAEEIIQRDGQVMSDRFGQSKPHPAVLQQREAHLAYLKLISGLGLPAPRFRSGLPGAERG